jgi:hypothetical protein
VKILALLVPTTSRRIPSKIIAVVVELAAIELGVYHGDDVFVLIARDHTIPAALGLGLRVRLVSNV